MPQLSEISDTLYIPLSGRIYTSEKFPDYFCDESALAVYEKHPEVFPESWDQGEYNYVASACRSRNMDGYVRDFLRRHPTGAVVNVGAGLEDLKARSDNGSATWFCLDLPEVLELRREYFPPGEREHYLPYSMFESAWMDEVREVSSEPVLVVAAGLFHYFEADKVIDFINSLAQLGSAYLVFDGVSRAGLVGVQMYMKKIGRQDASVYFSIDDPVKFVNECDNSVSLVPARKFFQPEDIRPEFCRDTKTRMKISNMFNMMKLIHLRIG